MADPATRSRSGEELPGRGSILTAAKVGFVVTRGRAWDSALRMDARPPAIDPDALLAEAGFLHALARDLARDAAAAEDLVQDTLLTALERPPR
jgi:hypothetical protein